MLKTGAKRSRCEETIERTAKLQPKWLQKVAMSPSYCHDQMNTDVPSSNCNGHKPIVKYKQADTLMRWVLEHKLHRLTSTLCGESRTCRRGGVTGRGRRGGGAEGPPRGLVIQLPNWGVGQTDVERMLQNQKSMCRNLLIQSTLTRNTQSIWRGKLFITNCI